MQTNLSTYLLRLVPFLLFAHSGQAQNLIGYYDGYGSQYEEFTNGSKMVSFTGSYFTNSSFLTNSLVNLNFQNERYITEDIKNDISSKMSEDNNRFGRESNFFVNYKSFSERFLGKDSMTVSIGYGIRDVQFIKVSEDGVDVYFRGNAPYAGETKNATANITSFLINQIRFGVEHVNNGNKWGAGVSLLLGAKYQNVNLRKGELYTQEDGEYVTFNTDLNFDYVGETETQFHEINGGGLSFDFSFLKKLNQTDYLRISVADLGFVQWANVNRIEADTNIHFEGVEVNNLFNFSEDDYNFPGDSLLDYFGLKSEQRGKTQWLPTDLTLSYYKQFNQRIAVTAGLKYIINAAYIPKVFLVGSYGDRKVIQGNLIATLGGYGEVMTGIGLEKLFAEKVGINLNLFLFGRTINPANSTSQAADIKLFAIF